MGGQTNVRLEAFKKSIEGNREPRSRAYNSVFLRTSASTTTASGARSLRSSAMSSRARTWTVSWGGIGAQDIPEEQKEVIKKNYAAQQELLSLLRSIFGLTSSA